MVALLIEKVTDLNFMLALLGGLAVAATVVMAVKGLKATMDAAVKATASEEPDEQIGKGGKVAAAVYETLDDYMADLNDPRYDTNETFRRQVMAKLDRSNVM